MEIWFDPFVRPWLELLGTAGLSVLVGMAGLVAMVASSPRMGAARYLIPGVWGAIGGMIAAFVIMPFLANTPKPHLGVLPGLLSLVPLFGWRRGAPGPPAGYWSSLAGQMVLFTLLTLPLDWGSDRCRACQIRLWEQVPTLQVLIFGVLLIGSVRAFHPARWVPHWTWSLPQALAMNLLRLVTPWLLTYTPMLSTSYRLQSSVLLNVVENLLYWTPVSAGMLAVYYLFLRRGKEGGVQ